MVDYAMLWVHSVSDYYQVTNDTSLILETYPTINEFIYYLLTLTNPTTGLIDLPKDFWGNTAYIDAFGYHSRYGQSTAVNSLFFETLQKGSQLALLVGDQSSAAAWTGHSITVKNSIESLLYMPADHRYATTIFQG